DQIQTAEDARGKSVLTAYAPVMPLGWQVFVELPTGEAYAPLYAAIGRTGWLLLTGLVLAVLAGALFALLMVVPIQKLRAGAARLGSGDLGQRIAIKTGDELEALADQFNDMAGKLQESYTDLENKVELRTRELTEALDQQTATSEVLGVISSSPGELDPVFEAMLENATRICEAKFGNLFLRIDEGFRAVAAHGLPIYADWIKRESLFVLKEHSRGPLAQLAETKEIVHVTDLTQHRAYVERDSRVVALVESAGARTMLLVPMLKDEELVGAIVIYRQVVRNFTDKQIGVVKNFADQAVIAIENVRLLNELRARTGELARSVEELRAL